MNALRILAPLFWRAYTQMFAVLLLILTIVLLLLVGLNMHQDSIEGKFADKQPHISIRPLDDISTQQQIDSVLKKIMRQQQSSEPLPITAMSPFIEGQKMLHIKAGITLPGSLSPSSYSKFSSIMVKVIGIEKKMPSVIDILSEKSYTAGPFRVHLTALEQVDAWVNETNSVIPNQVLDSSFYPPISQSVSLKIPASQLPPLTVYQRFIDYREEAVLYMDLASARQLLELPQQASSGVYLNVENTDAIAPTLAVLEQRLNQAKAHEHASQQAQPQYRIESWLAQAQKQASLLNMLNTAVLTICGLVLFLGSLLVLLSQYRSIIVKSQQLRILYAIGLRASTALSISAVIIFMAALFFAVLISDQLSQHIAPALALSYDRQLLMALSPYFSIILLLFCLATNSNIRSAIAQGVKV